MKKECIEPNIEEVRALSHQEEVESGNSPTTDQLISAKTSGVDLNSDGLKSTERLRQFRYSLVILDFHGTMTDHQLRLLRAVHRATTEVAGKDRMDSYFHAVASMLGIQIEAKPGQTVTPEQIYKDQVRLGKKIFMQEALSRPSKQSGQGVSNNEYMQKKFGGYFSQPEVDRMRQIAHEYLDTTYIPVPGINKTIKQLLAEGVNFAVLTNGSNRRVIQDTLSKWDLSELSDNLYSGHITRYKKPHRESIDYILRDYERQGVKTDCPTTLMVGDYLDDIRAAHNAGIHSALVVRGNGWEKFLVKDPKPNYIISDPNDLARIVHGEFDQEVSDEMDIVPELWKREAWGPQTRK